MTTQTPALLLREVLVILLMPLFLETAGGDLAFARAAAHEMLTSHGARSPLELLFTAQAFAFGVAALAAITTAPPEDASPSLTLRLRANANALHRSSERCWNTVERSVQTPLPRSLDPTEEAELIAAAASAVEMIATPARPIQPTAAPTPAQPTTTQAPILPNRPAPIPPATSASTGSTPPAQPMTYNAGWASAMADVAQEIAESLPTLPPQERYAAGIRIRALTSAAKQLFQSDADRRPLIRPSTEA